MKGGGQDQVETTSPGGTPTTSRWNPTKEQITMLENMYRQGIRTPTAEQIQEITGRLQAYGHIEGKNVFYWFQNHKARQRQKQKQENHFAAYGFHRYLHHQPVPPLFPPPSPNVVYGPSYYMPQPDLGFYSHQYPKVHVPASGMIKKRSQLANQLEINPGPSNGCIGGFYNNFVTSHPGYYSALKEHLGNDKHQSFNEQRDDQETLELFPMHPTGILQARTSHPTHNSTSTISRSYETTRKSITTAICMNNVEEVEEEEEEEEGSGTGQLYFDFFSGN